MIMCCWRPDARVAEQLLDVEQPARRPVDGVLAVAGAEERPGDGDLGEVDRQLARRVVDGQRHLGPAQLGTRGGPGEDDVLHLRRAQRARALGAEHPGHGVDHVGLAAPVRPDHHRDPGLELEHRRVGEGLETLHAERLQEHRGDPTGCLRAAWELTPGSARRRRSSARPPSPARWCCGSAGTAGPRGRRPGAEPWKSPSSPKRSRYCSSASEEPRCLMASAKRLDNGPVEPAHLGGGQRVGRPVVAQAGLVEHLVGVEVADAGREALVHQEGLDPPVVLVQQGAEAVPAHEVLDGVEAEVGQLGDGLADGGAVAARRPRDRAQRASRRP